MRILTVLLLCAAIAACNPKKKDASGVQERPASSASASKIVRNDVSFQTTGNPVVHQAFLTFEDGSLVPDNNKVRIGQRVVLHLIVEGWKPAANGKVMLGAAEKITTSEGQVIIDQDNLFDSYQDGVSEADARVITLSAVITAADKKFNYFEVTFRVWDKTAGDNVTGKYRLYPQG